MRPTGLDVAVFVSGSTTSEHILKAASVVREHRTRGHCLWLVAGGLLEDHLTSALSDGLGPVRVLDAAGVDGVVLRPDWFAFGTDKVEELVDRSTFTTLGANLVDTAGQPVGQDLSVKRLDGIAIGLFGVWLDTADPWLDLTTLDCLAADFAVRRTVPLLRKRAEVVGLLASRDVPVPGWDVDFAVGAMSPGCATVPVPGSVETLAFVNLHIENGRVGGFSPQSFDISEAGPDSAVRAAVDSVQAAVDSIAEVEVAELRVPLIPESLLGSLTGLFPGVDCFLDDTAAPLVTKTIGPGVVTVGDMAAALSRPGRVALTELTREEYAMLLGQGSVVAAPRNPVPGDHGTVRVACSVGCYIRHLRKPGSRFELSEEPLWVMACAAVSDPGGKP